VPPEAATVDFSAIIQSDNHIDAEVKASGFSTEDNDLLAKFILDCGPTEYAQEGEGGTSFLQVAFCLFRLSFSLIPLF
jgi:precorrin isomerase